MKRRRFHRTLLYIAATYNVLWALYALADPQWLFRFADMPLLNHPGIFAGLGAVIGPFGLAYLYAARHPERGFLLILGGFLGKSIGLLGITGLIAEGTWPPASFIFTLTNDLVWLPFFALYLYDARPSRMRALGLNLDPEPSASR